MHRHFGEIMKPGAPVSVPAAVRAVAVRVALCGLMALWTAVPARASAQVPCAADAGSCQDGGAPPAAGAPGADGGRADSSGPGVGGSICSCETLDEKEGRLHVCTDSYERDVCAQFSCSRGTERARACPSRGVKLCCELPKQGTQSRLYDDCTHPNCESGFRDQCGDFGGTVHEGDCDVSATPSSRKKTSLCAVASPGAPGGRVPWALSSWPVAVLALRRRRARRR